MTAHTRPYDRPPTRSRYLRCRACGQRAELVAARTLGSSPGESGYRVDLVYLCASCGGVAWSEVVPGRNGRALSRRTVFVLETGVQSMPWWVHPRHEEQCHYRDCRVWFSRQLWAIWTLGPL